MPDEDYIIGENGSVRYTVKELFASINAKMDTLVLAVGEKAEALDLQAVEIRVKSLEDDRLAAVAVRADRRHWLGGVTVVSLLGLGLGIWEAFIR